MADERQLVIIKGEEFRLSVRDEIKEEDIFYDQYLNAARMLDDILAAGEDESDRAFSEGNKKYPARETWCRTEYENNIIAFCGERGEGKSSVMMSFVRAVYKYGSIGGSVFADCENVKKASFSEPIVIDPSMLDDVHNVLDIVLATLYKKFRDLYDRDNQFCSAYMREELLDQFQKVYKSVSLINNQDKMLDDEYDYEGNISKLSRLGQSTGLKDDLKKLIRTYMKIMPDTHGNDHNSGNLLIAIDDLDLCNAHAYKMAEQIRKYLIIPNVVIVMAIKAEQLELCVREQNLINYKNVMQAGGRQEGFGEEVAGMAERYVAKLIPQARRIYLPNVRTMHKVRILYRDNDKEILKTNLGDSVSDIVLQMIYEKTGMKFLPDESGENYFLPDNLRDTINILVLLAGMEDPQGNDGVYYDNIQKFADYYEKQWLFRTLGLKRGKEIQKLLYEKTRLHEKIVFLLNWSYRSAERKKTIPSKDIPSDINNHFFEVMNWLEIYRNIMLGEDEKEYAYVFHILYTIRLNELLRAGQYCQLYDFIGGYLWAGTFTGVLPTVQDTALDRSRFVVSTVPVVNTIAGEVYGDNHSFQPSTVKSQIYITEISKSDVRRKDKIVTWLLIGLLSNICENGTANHTVCKYDTRQIISTNHAVSSKLQISLENYIVGLCNLESMYDKVNMEFLGIEKPEFDEVVHEMQEANKEIIEAVRKLATNVDILMSFKEYCSERKGIKERGTKDALARSEAAVKIFFDNAGKFLKKEFGLEGEPDYLNLKIDNRNRVVDITHLYALLVQAGMDEEENKDMGERLIAKFTSKLQECTEQDVSLEKVSTYLISKTAQNAKNNLEKLASNIQRYYSMHKEEQLREEEISELGGFYETILDVFLEDPAKQLSEELVTEYKRIYNKHQKTCQE